MSGAAYTLPARATGKPGELTLMIGLLLCAIAPFVLVIVHTEADELALLEASGVVTEAEIIAHDSREIARTDNKGRERSTTSYLIEVRYDVMARTPYAAWAGGKGLTPSRYPALTTTTFEVSQSDQAASPVGSRKMVAFLTGDPGKMKLASTIAEQTSFAYFAGYYAAMAAMLAAGAWLVRRGWRQTRAAGG